MKLSLVASVFVSLLSGAVAQADANAPCPTVTSVTEVCSTCARPMCMQISTLSAGCNCPEAVATVFTGYPCDGPCPGGCGGTQYVQPTATPECEGSNKADPKPSS